MTAAAALSAAAPSKLSMMAASSGVSLRRHSCSIQSGTGHRAAAIDAAMAACVSASPPSEMASRTACSTLSASRKAVMASGTEPRHDTSHA